MGQRPRRLTGPHGPDQLLYCGTNQPECVPRLLRLDARYVQIGAQPSDLGLQASLRLAREVFSQAVRIRGGLSALRTLSHFSTSPLIRHPAIPKRLNEVVHARTLNPQLLGDCSGFAPAAV